jgi:hypothetical protein
MNIFVLENQIGYLGQQQWVAAKKLKVVETIDWLTFLKLV